MVDGISKAGVLAPFWFVVGRLRGCKMGTVVCMEPPLEILPEEVCVSE